MRTKFILLLIAISSINFVYSQSSRIAYQAVIYKPDVKSFPGQSPSTSPLVNQAICLRFSILDGSGVMEYQETIATKTDNYGIVNTQIGSGNQTSGYSSSFEAIIWNSPIKEIIVEVDLTSNCSSFTEISRQSLSPIPFATNAALANNVSGVVAIENGGTGATTSDEARLKLGVESLGNKSNDILTDRLSVTKYPSVKAIKDYVDTVSNSITVPEATATTAGKIKLGGDLGGDYSAPSVVKLKGIPLDSSLPQTSQLLQFNGASWQPVAIESVVKMFAEEVFPSSTNQTVFATTKAPMGNISFFINGVRIPKDAITVSGSTITYLPGLNGGYQTLLSDRINIEYLTKF